MYGKARRGTPNAWIAAMLSLCVSGCVQRPGVGALRLDPPAPELRGLTDLKGEFLDLALLVREHDATVLIWFASTCPCVRRYQPRMEALRKAYPADRVAVLAVASNADDDHKTLRETLAERGFRLPLAVDYGGKLAMLFGVRSTPTVVLLDRRGQVRFLGWMDNERQPGESGRVAYLRSALDSVLGNGDGDAAERSPVYGCTITRSLTGPGQCAVPPQTEHSHRVTP